MLSHDRMQNFSLTLFLLLTSKIMSSSGSSGVSQAVGLAAQFGINIPTGQAEPKWVIQRLLKVEP